MVEGRWTSEHVRHFLLQSLYEHIYMLSTRFIPLLYCSLLMTHLCIFKCMNSFPAILCGGLGCHRQTLFWLPPFPMSPSLSLSLFPFFFCLLPSPVSSCAPCSLLLCMAGIFECVAWFSCVSLVFSVYVVSLFICTTVHSMDFGLGHDHWRQDILLDFWKKNRTSGLWTLCF